MSTDSLPDPAPRARRLIGERGRPMKTLEVRLKTTTPILGGSSAPRQLDALDPIRAPSIRGHLRFWWRALHGHAYASSSELALRERELWGGVGKSAGDKSAGRRSCVEVHVRMESDLCKQEPDTSEIPRGAQTSYALWVASSQTTTGQKPAPRWPPSVHFVLHLLAPVDRVFEVETALRAWILWGGYGSRTRRGLGSLTVLDDAAQWLPSLPTREEWSRLFPGLPLLGTRPAGGARPMPGLEGARLLYGTQGMNSKEAWEAALGWLCDFRQRQKPFPPGTRTAVPQKPGALPSELARELKPGRPGRSYWPESDKVRQLIPHPKGTSWAHVPRPQYKNRSVSWPRAGFGLPLPIRFQKKDRQENYYPEGEPPEVELQWHDGERSHDRFASPVIVKAMPLADGRFVPIALWLCRAWPDKGHVVLMKKHVLVRGSEAAFDRLLTPEDTALYAPLLKANLEEAFLSWVKGFRDVKEST